MDRRILLKVLGAGAVSTGFGPSAWSESVLATSKSPVPETSHHHRTTKIIGVGGAGCNFIHSFGSSLVLHKFPSLTELVCVDLGMESMPSVDTVNETAVGCLPLKSISLARYGAGGRVNVARVAAIRNIDVLKAVVSGLKTAIVVAGLGGDTGSAVAPILARLARIADVATIAVVVMPFDFEGPRNGTGDAALRYLEREVDLVVPFSNQELGDSMGDGALLADIYSQQDQRITTWLQRLNLG